jgi:hypothetical protein
MELRFPPGSEALSNAHRRIAAAAEVQKKVESAVGAALAEILGGAYVKDR